MRVCAQQMEAERLSKERAEQRKASEARRAFHDSIKRKKAEQAYATARSALRPK